MNCSAVQRHLSAERDHALGAGVREQLEAHLVSCASCRQVRATLAEAAEVWRTHTASAHVPDPRLEWERVRRKLHAAPGDQAFPSRRLAAAWRGLSLAGAAAAAVLVGFIVAPGWLDDGTVLKNPPANHGEFVEVGGSASSAMVYVDDKSGWLVVWAAGPTD